MQILGYGFHRFKFQLSGLLLALSFLATGQNLELEKKLAEEGRKILEHAEYAERKKANLAFAKMLSEYIATEEGYSSELKPVTNMMRLFYKEEWRMFTWQMPDSNYQYQRFGVFVANTKRGIVVTELEDKASTDPQAMFRVLKPNNWYGAIYYKSIPVKKGRNLIFTLLGYAPGTTINQKIIDVLEVDARGRPKFGARVFKIDDFMDKTLRKAPMRLILSYGAKYSASVRWNEDEKMIIMDHLSPPELKLKGIYHLYGPDMSYDALYWEKDWWHLKTEVKFNTRQNIKIVPPDKPTDLPKK